MSTPKDIRVPLKNINDLCALWLEDVCDEYKQMVGLMVREDPSSRPTAMQLLMSPLLRQFR